MIIRRVVANISTNLLKESIKFYTELFGFQVAMDMDWIVTLAFPSNPIVQISLIRGEQLAKEQIPVSLSIEVDDVDAVHSKAVTLYNNIVYPLTNESWGVRRFHVKDPNGIIINVMSHIKQNEP